jgi:hypothetical protein
MQPAVSANVPLVLLEHTQTDLHVRKRARQPHCGMIVMCGTTNARRVAAMAHSLPRMLVLAPAASDVRRGRSPSTGTATPSWTSTIKRTMATTPVSGGTKLTGLHYLPGGKSRRTSPASDLQCTLILEMSRLVTTLGERTTWCTALHAVMATTCSLLHGHQWKAIVDIDW